jgi:hypothetical protein
MQDLAAVQRNTASPGSLVREVGSDGRVVARGKSGCQCS